MSRSCKHLPLAGMVLAGLGMLARPGASQSAPAGHGEHAHASGEVEKLGRVDFAVSCSPAAQEKFGRAVALLHSFWYDEAEKAFAEVTRIDPACAMGYWGVAMSLFHPVWAAGNPAAAPSRAELERGAEALSKAKATAAPTERERDYIGAVEAYYRDFETREHPQRAAAFEAAMERVHERHPEDREAAIFHALALLGTAPPDDKTYAHQRRAGAILNPLLPLAPEHPGIAHYLIHCYDYPQLAELGLPAARAYSRIAASSPHALHMPSHIYTRLALWDDSIRSNLASAETARRHVARTRPGAASFDQLHALDYLAYAYLQTGRDEKARAALAEATAVRDVDVPNFAAAYALAAVPARFALERREWREAAATTLHGAGIPWERFPFAEALVHFARAVGGARGGDLATTKEAVKRLEAIRKAREEARDPYWAGQVEVQRLAGVAWIARAEGRAEEALALLRRAADLEDASEKHPVTPGAVLPARELLADLLLDLGRPAEALVEYEASLEGAPGRFNSVLGAARAAARAGNRKLARRYYGQLLVLAEQAEGRKAELDEARGFLTGAPEATAKAATSLPARR